MTEKRPRRRFNSLERAALYAAADSCCQCDGCSACGPQGYYAPLRRGWHADHDPPCSKVHETDIANGRALCPRCTSRKAIECITATRSNPGPSSERSSTASSTASHPGGLLPLCRPASAREIPSPTRHQPPTPTGKCCRPGGGVPAAHNSRPAMRDRLVCTGLQTARWPAIISYSMRGTAGADPGHAPTPPLSAPGEQAPGLS